MEREDREKLSKVLDRFLDRHLEILRLSNSADPDQMLKMKMRPLLLRGHLVFQAEEFAGTQVFHRNLTKEEAGRYISGLLEGQFRQCEITSAAGSACLLVSKKGKLTVKVKHRPVSIQEEGGASCPKLPEHNRVKRYVLPEGTAVPFLVDLGVMTRDGAVVRQRYDKFRQINRFLEFIEDILPRLDKEQENTIIDFGCGKSYLTFAMYYYLKELKGYPVRIIGLDLKTDVIRRCNQLAERYGYEHLKFYQGDIASFEGAGHVDMVVTLHACDTATDYALAKAVRWNAKVILSVPCCQHELNEQIGGELMKPVYQYGLVRERLAALYTDALRAQILEHCGYRTQILEFIDMEHTPKNILIRAVRQGEPRDNLSAIQDVMDFLHVTPTLAKLLL